MYSFLFLDGLEWAYLQPPNSSWEGSFLVPSGWETGCHCCMHLCAELQFRIRFLNSRRCWKVVLRGTSYILLEDVSNPSGVLFLDFCASRGSSIMNTSFRAALRSQTGVRLNTRTWTSTPHLCSLTSTSASLLTNISRCIPTRNPGWLRYCWGNVMLLSGLMIDYSTAQPELTSEEASARSR